MRISASEQVAEWLGRLPPETKRRVRAALKGLEDWKHALGKIVRLQLQSPLWQTMQ